MIPSAIDVVNEIRRSRTEQRLRMTYAEYYAWSGEDTHAEWVDGEVTVFIPPLVIHQRISGFLYMLLSRYVRGFNLGEVFITLTEMCTIPGRAYRQPDLMFVRTEHQDRITAERVAQPADLVIEIVSETSAQRDYHEKYHEYATVGVGEYWIIDPRECKQKVTCYQRTSQGSYQQRAPDPAGRSHSLVAPGFWMQESWFWQEPLPSPESVFAQIVLHPITHRIAVQHVEARGRQQGREEERRDIARQMLNDGFDYARIKKYTGLTDQDIATLANVKRET